MRILVADDDQFSRHLLRMILEKEGNELVEAPDGQAAWTLLDEGLRPDLCILDLLMPELDGLGLLKRIRSDERLRSLKVILCSSTSDRDTVAGAAALSINYYIVKPYSRALVVEQVRRVAQQLSAPRSMEDPAAVCQRLGIDRDTYQRLLEMLVEEMTRGIQAVREALLNQDLKAAQLRVNGLKGAGANLGANVLAAKALQVESAMAVDNAPAPNQPQNPQDRDLLFKAWHFIHGEATLLALADLEKECHRLVSANAEPAQKLAGDVCQDRSPSP